MKCTGTTNINDHLIIWCFIRHDSIDQCIRSDKSYNTQLTLQQQNTKHMQTRYRVNHIDYLMPNPSSSFSIRRLWVIGFIASRTIKMQLHVLAVLITWMTWKFNKLKSKPRKEKAQRQTQEGKNNLFSVFQTISAISQALIGITHHTNHINTIHNQKGKYLKRLLQLEKVQNIQGRSFAKVCYKMSL